MNASTTLKTLQLAATSALIIAAAHATPSFAAGEQDDVHFARAGGPRVELRVTSPKRESTQVAARMTRYARG
ncbi:MAG: hypothetical protein K2Y35_01290 [Burkholderiales bacterium]|nr:hypothetical protein [Burkholderiales bacterium]